MTLGLVWQLKQNHNVQHYLFIIIYSQQWKFFSKFNYLIFPQKTFHKCQKKIKINNQKIYILNNPNFIL